MAIDPRAPNKYCEHCGALLQKRDLDRGDCWKCGEPIVIQGPDDNDQLDHQDPTSDVEANTIDEVPADLPLTLMNKMIICQSCGIEAPTRFVEFNQNIGAFIERYHKKVSGYFCKSCINRYFWSFTGTTLILGWWGVISFWVTPFFILSNLYYYLGALFLSNSTMKAPQKILTESASKRIYSFEDEILNRIRSDESLEHIVEDITFRAKVTPEQVLLYLALGMEQYVDEIWDRIYEEGEPIDQIAQSIASRENVHVKLVLIYINELRALNEENYQEESYIHYSEDHKNT